MAIKYILVVCAILLALFTSLTSCAQQAAPSTTTAAPKPTAATTAAPTTTASTTAAPATATATATAPKPSAVGSVADFYKGQRITIVHGSGPGGSNDFYARLIATFMTDMLNCQVAVVAEPAASGMVAFNKFASSVKPDGLSLLFTASGTLWSNWLGGVPEVQYDINKYEYLGGIPYGPSWVFVAKNGPYTSVDALKKGKTLKFATSTPYALSTLGNVMAVDTLGLDAQIITGFKDAAARRLAVQQGQVAGTAVPGSAIVTESEVMQKLFPVSLQRVKAYPDVPCLGELANLSDTQKKLMTLVFDDGKIVLVPPGTPKDRVDFLADTMTKILADKSFQAMAGQIGPWMGSEDRATVTKRAADLVTLKDLMKGFDPLVQKYVK